jgi:hypothetical protein
MAHRKKHMNFSAEENKVFLETEMFKLKETYYVRTQAVAEDLREQMEKAKQKYLADQQKRVAEDALELQRWQLRYEAMDKKALEEEARKYLHDGGFTPDRLDVLNAALIRAGVKKIAHAEQRIDAGRETTTPPQEKPFGEYLIERRYDEPWLHENPELTRSLELYDQSLGSFKVLDENGMINEMEIEAAYMEKTDA